MKSLRGLTRGAAKIGLVGIVFGIAALTLAKDGRPAAGAATTEILPSLSSTAPNYASTKILIQGGDPSATPCTPVTPNPTAACLYIWAKNVNNTTGASAFQVHLEFDSNGFTMNGVVSQRTWLGSTNRSVGCPPPSISPGDVLLGCSTLLAPPPYGPNCPTHCNGLLASIALESKMAIGTYTLNFSSGNRTFLVDTPSNPDNAIAIPATVRSTNIIVTRCPDFTGDGTVRVADILYVVHKFFTNDVLADLSGDGMVRVNDILIAVGLFFADCPA